MTHPASAASERALPPAKRWRGARSAPYVFVAPFVVLFIVFLLVPLVVAVVSSFFATKQSGLGFGDGPSVVFVGINNYVTAVMNSGFVAGFGRVILFGIVQVPVMLGAALILALVIDSALVRYKRLFQLSVFLPYAVPGVVAALLWGFLYQPGVSPVVQALHSMGIPADFLAPGTVLWSVANVTTWSYVGVNMVIMYAGLQAIPAELYEAAKLDGAGGLRLALSVKIPLILPSILLTLLFSIIGTLQLFNEPMVLRSITSNVTSDYTPNMSIFNVTIGQNNANLGATMAIILGLVTFVLSLAVSRFYRPGRTEAR